MRENTAIGRPLFSASVPKDLSSLRELDAIAVIAIRLFSSGQHTSPQRMAFSLGDHRTAIGISAALVIAAIALFGE
jgi:hypothetical protein